jgi:flagellum-specific peptidoglycan hydrolase FlgJ
MNQQQNSFLRMAAPLAQAAQRRWNVPASVTIAQAILESSNSAGWGQSQLAREANNFFGIKATHTDDPNSYIQLQTHEYIHGQLEEVPADFERFISPQASFNTHALLLASALRYKPAMAVRADAFAFANALAPCGYSTNPNYGALLGRIMRDYDLTQYDIEPDGSAKAAAAA